ncbi:hypothetical protein Psefu_0224 [Pseudomonas fulva 12-X]|uniref:Uncharacterized protein n=1 Tax=Pseudomonas fulva (strain 12-X) TaxID=743720 RepID=F6AED4_PSEF1|nr:hypothetical protein Psefu_0224 [Pseudomonas fulva 12-X]
MSIPVCSLAHALALPALRSRGRAPEPTALPQILAFWALWHCRHARPPDALSAR